MAFEQEVISEIKRFEKGTTKRFYDNLIDHSENKNWKKAINEWVLTDITKKEHTTKCICGHIIKERCIIKNIKPIMKIKHYIDPGGKK